MSPRTFKAAAVLASRVLCNSRAVLNFLHDEAGQGQVEYGLITMLLSLCAIASTRSMSSNLVNLWTGITTTLSANM